MQSTSFWDREIVSPRHTSWMESRRIRDYINELICADSNTWPIEWFESRFADRLPFGRVLSIGCGTGVLERQLVERGIAREVEAFDGSIASVAAAARAARETHLPIRYFVANFNLPVLPPRRYDAVFFHQSMHHVAALERMYRWLLRAMKRDALLYLDEYIGPARFEWNEERVAQHDRYYQRVPRERRRGDHVPPPIQDDDPSEAVRSSEIVPRLRIGFELLEKRDYGGNLLSVLYPLVDWNDTLLEETIAEESRWLAAGDPSYHAIIVARPRRGLMKMAATLRYRAVSWLRRHEIARMG